MPFLPQPCLFLGLGTGCEYAGVHTVGLRSGQFEWICTVNELQAVWCDVLQEIAEPLSDLKQGISELRQSRTLKCILSTILAVGNFLNGTEVS